MQELSGQGLVFFSRHDQQLVEDYEDLLDYADPDLVTEEEAGDYSDLEDGVLEDIVGEEEVEEPEVEDFYPNGTVIKFHCSQTKPTQFASWQIR